MSYWVHCDGCGVQQTGSYENLEGWKALKLGAPNAGMALDHKDPRYDLCPDCLQGLQAFMDGCRAGGADAKRLPFALQQEVKIDHFPGRRPAL